jgi:transposase
MHVRRKFFDAQSAAPEAAKQAMDFILEVYKIERAALDADLLGSPEHLEMRQTASRSVMDDFKAWLDAEQVRQPPKGSMGEAIGYALGQWDASELSSARFRRAPGFASRLEQISSTSGHSLRRCSP